MRTADEEEEEVEEKEDEDEDEDFEDFEGCARCQRRRRCPAIRSQPRGIANASGGDCGIESYVGGCAAPCHEHPDQGIPSLAPAFG